MRLSDCVDDQGFECVGPIAQRSVEVRVDAELAKSGLLVLLAQWIKRVPTNKEMRGKFIGGGGVGYAKVDEELDDIVKKSGNGDEKHEREIKEFLSEYRAYFSLVNCDRLGIVLNFVHPDDSGPAEDQVKPMVQGITDILGAERVSHSLSMSRESAVAFDNAFEDAVEDAKDRMRKYMGPMLWSEPTLRRSR